MDSLFFCYSLKNMLDPTWTWDYIRTIKMLNAATLRYHALHLSTSSKETVMSEYSIRNKIIQAEHCNWMRHGGNSSILLCVMQGLCMNASSLNKKNWTKKMVKRRRCYISTILSIRRIIWTASQIEKLSSSSSRSEGGFSAGAGVKTSDGGMLTCISWRKHAVLFPRSLQISVFAPALSRMAVASNLPAKIPQMLAWPKENKSNPPYPHPVKYMGSPQRSVKGGKPAPFCCGCGLWLRNIRKLYFTDCDCICRFCTRVPD